MRSAVAAGLVGVVVADHQCPGSPARFTHAGIQMTATAAASCDIVKAEMQSRVAGENGWYDQHNRGTFTEQNYGGDFSASRLTGDGKYTDKIIFVLTPEGGNCKIEGCSESQVTSVADNGANYCEVKLLYCGSDEGCNVAHSDFTNSGEETHTMAGASTGIGNCLKVEEQTLQMEAEWGSYNCPGSYSLVHARMKVTVQADASCADVEAEIAARANDPTAWADPRDGGVYLFFESATSGVIETGRVSNPTTRDGQLGYNRYERQTFELTSVDGGCQIKGCSDSQKTSVADFSTNYCDLRNLYCGSSENCVSVRHDFNHREISHAAPVGSGHDSSACGVAPVFFA